MPRSIRIILNGKSAGEPTIRDAVAELRRWGHEVSVRVTWEFGDAARFATEAADESRDVIVAAGGDGTVNEVVGGVMASSNRDHTSVAVLPLGTANDFATASGIPIADPLAALRLAAEGEAFAIDIGKVNEHYFVNVASGGFGAEVTANTPPDLKRAMGGAAYSLMGVITAAKAKPRQCRVTLPDGSVHEGDVLVMTIANGKQCGGGQQVAPRALLNDGQLDFLVIHDVDIQSFGQVLAELMTLGDEANEFVSYAQLSSLRIESDNDLQLNIDGEPVHSKRFDFSVVPNAIRFVLPKTAPLFVAE